MYLYLDGHATSTNANHPGIAPTCKQIFMTHDLALNFIPKNTISIQNLQKPNPKKPISMLASVTLLSFTFEDLF